jgi:hypothetical protein
MGASLTTIEPSKNRQVLGSTKGKPFSGCPYDELIKAYHAELPDNPQCIALSDPRKRHIRARWEFWRSEGKYDTVEQGIAWWRDFFRFVGESRFLTGQAKSQQEGRDPFVANIDFLIGAETHVKVVEGRYHEAVAA